MATETTSQTAAADTNQVIANPTVDPTVEMKEVAFRFKKDKMGDKRPNVEIKNFPMPSAIGIAKALNAGGKQAQLIVDAVYDVIRSVAADIVGNDPKISEATFPWAQVSLEAVANMERADRRVSTIPDELWAEFVADYQSVMPSVAGKSAEAVKLATDVYLKKFSIVKTNKEILAKLQAQLGLYMENSKNAAEYTEILDLLLRRAANYLAADDVKILAENL